MRGDEKLWDVIIIGGGLAGLSAAILLSKQSFSVLLLEKDAWPNHKVCGEYISNESRSFLVEDLHISLTALDAKIIEELRISSPYGTTFSQSLSPGGIGVSRYNLDTALRDRAVASGTVIREKLKVESIEFADHFIVTAAGNTFFSKTCLGAFGKRSNLDIKLERPFIKETARRLNNYVGIKYHVAGDFNPREISLHLFRGGYCGLVEIEKDRFNLCYLVKADVLKRCGNSIEEMERSVLANNPALKHILKNAVRLFEKPEAISQISFSKKSIVEDHMLCIGDAGGMITPLCGNGMSIALHCGKLAANATAKFLRNDISRAVMEQEYSSLWQKHFAARLRTGRRLQWLFGKEKPAEILIWFMKRVPGLAKYIIGKTHGKSF